MQAEYVRRLRALMAEIATKIVAHPCSDYAEYRQLAGRWQGLSEALALLEQLEQEADERSNGL